MTSQSQLTSTQFEVLTLAANRPDGNIQPLPDRLPGGAKIKVLAGLLTRQLIAEKNESHFLTDAGYKAVGKIPAPVQASQSRANSKQATIIVMLKRPEGVTIPRPLGGPLRAELTGRGTCAGTIKKKLSRNLLSDQPADGDRVYRIG